MTPQRYRQITEVFAGACELTGAARASYLDQACKTDPDLRREVEELLNFHRPAPPPPSTSPTIDTRAPWKTRLRTPLKILAGAAVAAVALAVVQTWTWKAVEGRLRESQEARIAAFLQVRVAIIEGWAEKVKGRIREALEDPSLGPHVERLAQIADVSSRLKDDLANSPSFDPVQQRMERVREKMSGKVTGVITPSGVVVAGNRSVGSKVMPSGGAYLRRSLLGEWIIGKPYRDHEYIEGGAAETEVPVMFTGGPIRNEEGRIVALGVMCFKAEKEFDTFFSSPESDRAPEIFAFDQKGVVLTPMRDTERLKALGLLQEPGTALNLRLRDPGGDLEHGYTPESASDPWPMTLMFRSASLGTSGSNLKGYRNVRGVEVIGAWTWLPTWEMGVAVELELSEVLAPMASVRTAFRVLFGMLALITGALLWGATGYGLYRRDRKSGSFGTYVLDRRLATGTTEEIYLAKHAVLKRPTAIKILNTLEGDPRAAVWFEREARLASRLTHPNTIQIFDYGSTPDGRFYCAMEHLEGLNLAQLISLTGPLPVGRAVHLLRQICGSLEEAHAAGLIHRDLKPANIMLCRRGGQADVVKVLDFGIDRSFDLTQPRPPTPLYVAPERIRSPQAATALSDLYSLGAVAFHLLTGRNVFEGTGTAEVLYQMITAERPSPSRVRGEALPAALERLIQDCLAVDPEKRPPSARAIRETLESMAIADRWGAEQARSWWTANEEKIATVSSA